MIQISQEEIFASIGITIFFALILFAIFSGFKQLEEDAEKIQKEYRETGKVDFKKIKFFFGFFSLDEFSSNHS